MLFSSWERYCCCKGESHISPILSKQSSKSCSTGVGVLGVALERSVVLERSVALEKDVALEGSVALERSVDQVTNGHRS